MSLFNITPDAIAQLAHVAWGALLFDSLAARIKWQKAAAIVAGVYVVKEVLESTIPIWEPLQPWKSGLEDMLFWTVGLGLGYLLYKFVDRGN